jgi:hypothetical protein
MNNSASSSLLAARVLATMFVWGGVSILGSFTDVTGGFAVMMIAILAFAAMMSTRAVWGIGGQSADTQAQLEKAKRVGSMRLGRIVDSLSDDEIAELRMRLMGNDEEVVPLDSLLSRQHDEPRGRLSQ